MKELMQKHPKNNKKRQTETSTMLHLALSHAYLYLQPSQRTPGVHSRNGVLKDV